MKSELSTLRPELQHQTKVRKVGSVGGRGLFSDDFNIYDGQNKKKKQNLNHTSVQIMFFYYIKYIKRLTEFKN